MTGSRPSVSRCAPHAAPAAGARARRRGLRAIVPALATAAIGALAGCGFAVPDYVHRDWKAPAPIRDGLATETAAPRPEPMLGLAFSGGGSRAAVFAASVLSELEARAGVARDVTHISAVSGGSFAAAYLATKPIASACPDGADAECRARYFEAFGRAMESSLLWPTLRRQVVNPTRFTSPTRRAISLGESLDAAFLEGRRFGDLPPRPVLLINAARYTDFRRFVFSQSALTPTAPGAPPFDNPVLRQASFSLPGCPRPAPADMRLSLAVATSAAFPPAFGPVTLELPVDCAGSETRYWHLGDGGVIDNSGLDTLREAAMGQAQAGRAVLIAVDAGRLHDPETMARNPDVRIWTNNPGIVLDAAQARGGAFADAAWDAAARRAGVEWRILRLRYADTPVVDWPAVCGDRPGRSADGAQTDAPLQRILAIPTALSIGACDAALLRAAARALAAAHEGEIRAALAWRDAGARRFASR